MPPKKDWIQTYTGRAFCPLDPRAEDVDVRDIAHALSMLCRFNGHCLRFYSVAEHSVRVSRLLGDPRLALWGLLHDAAEAYTTDLPRPLKKRMPLFEEVELGVLRVVMDKFGLPFPMPADVCAADDTLLATEARDLMAAPPEPWGLLATPLPGRIDPVLPDEAERLFLARFEELALATRRAAG